MQNINAETKRLKDRQRALTHIVHHLACAEKKGKHVASPMFHSRLIIFWTVFIVKFIKNSIEILYENHLAVR